ncbi:hypothetical protein AALA82_14540 [Oscillospiraceae bacterium 50-16]
MLLNEMMAGHELILTRACGGTGTVEVSDMVEQTGLQEEKQTLKLTDEKDGPDGKTVTVQISSLGNEAEYLLQQIGVYAKLGTDGAEKLLFIMQDEGVLIPAESDKSFLLEIFCTLRIGENGKLTVIVDPTGIVTLDRLSQTESKFDRLLGEIDPLSGTGEPDSTTPGQVGQKYEDTTSGDIYTCTAITPGESGASPHYLWVPGRLGTLAEIRTAYSNIAGRIIGQQILRNAYWMTKENIINQREKLLYNKNGYTIDGWILWDANTSLEVVDQGLVTHSGGSIQQTPLVQKLEVNCLIPGIYTLSIFATKNVGFPNYFVEDIGDIPGHINADSGLVTFTFEVPDAVKDKTHWVSFEAQDDSLIKAAKLEPGPTQTLAHKDAAGNWVLNDPMPDKGLELLKCQRYLKYVSDDPIGYGYIGARGDAAWLAVPLSVPMRTTPTLVTTGKKIAIRGNGIEKVVEMSEVRVDRLRDDKILLKIPMTGIPAYTSVVAISAEANYDLFFSAEL